MCRHGFVGVACLFAAFGNAQVIPVFLQQSLSSAAISGSGSSIVFCSSYANSNYVADVFSVNVDGSNLRQLTKLSTGTTGVALSSDGHWASFTAGQSGINEEVHLLNVTADSDSILTVDKQGCVLPLAICVGCVYTCLRTPHVTDDGSAILYAAERSQPFYVVKNDGSSPANLPVYSGNLAASPKRVIARNGQVVFSSNSLTSPTQASPGQVYLMNLDGTNIRAVTQLSGESVYPLDATISADGSEIAFTVSSASGTTIYTVRADGSQMNAVASGHVSSPSLSADGSLLTYVDTGQAVLLALSVPSAGSKKLTNLQYSRVNDATISDDGTRVAFTIGPQNGGNGAIYSIGSNATNQQAAYAPRTINPSGVQGAVAGSLVSIYGTNFIGDALITAGALPLPKTLGGVSAEINGAAAPLLGVSSWQINAQIPPDVPPSTTTTFDAAFSDGSHTAAIQANVAFVFPTVYFLASDAFTGAQAAVFHGNTAIAADPAHPATTGEALVLYASGLGPTNPTVPAGVAPPANPPATTAITPQVSVGGKPALLLFSGLAPGFVGVYQINFLLPAGLPAGTQSISITSAGQSGGSGVISVQ